MRLMRSGGPSRVREKNVFYAYSKEKLLVLKTYNRE